MKPVAMNWGRGVAVLAGWLALAGPGTAGELSWKFHYSPDDAGLAAKGEYTLVTLAGGGQGTASPGAPDIPAQFVNFLLPAGASNVVVSATGNPERLAGEIVPHPVQRPFSPSKPMPAFVPPDPVLYEASEPWPAELAQCEGVHDMQGERFVSVRINPVQYLGAEKELRLCPDVAIRIAYDAPEAAAVRARSAGQAELAGEMVNALVVNPRLPADDPAKKGVARAAEADYLIITSAGLSDAFQKLADYRSTAAGGGYSTRIVTLADIGANYPGTDIQMKIRACISNHVATCGTSYVVLGGDDSVVPDRDCYAFVDPWSESHMPTDLYYSDLTGSWKASGASSFGTVEAKVDMAPDVIVGRIPVRTADQAEQYIAKVKGYETDSHPTDKLLLAGSVLGTVFTGSERPTDDVTADGHPGFRSTSPAHPSVSDTEQWVRRLYRDGIHPYGAAKVSLACDTITSWDSSTCGDAPFTPANFTKWLNHNWTHLVFMGHGNPQVLTVENEEHFVPGDAGAMTGLVACVYTTACLSGAFDEDGIRSTGVTTDVGTKDEWHYPSEPCIAEGFLRNAKGGALAYIGCARFGWFSENYTGGASATYAYKFETRLNEAAAKSANRTIGKAFALHKADMIAQCSYDGSPRWLQFGLNLLGDPALVLQPRGTGPSVQTVTFDAHGGTCGTAKKEYAVGEAYGWLPEATCSGSVFLGWFTAASGGEQITAGSIVGAVPALTLHAQWQKAPSTTQTVTFNAHGGSCGTSKKEYTIGAAYGWLPEATLSGYSFEGWFTAASGGEKITADSIVQAVTSLTLHAQWKEQPKTQTVTFDPMGGTCQVESRDYAIGSKYGWLPTPSKSSWADWFHSTSYAFLGWYTAPEGGGLVGTDSTVSAEGTRTLYAHWKASTRQSVYFYGNGGLPEQQTQSYVVGGLFGEFPEVTWADHTFEGWYTSEGERVSESDTMPDKSLYLYAHWKAAPAQTVTFNANGGTCRTDSQSYTIGSPYGWLPTATWAGHRWTGWFTDVEGGSPVMSSNIVGTVSAITLYAHWEEDGDVFWLSGYGVSERGGIRTVRFRGVKGTTYQLQGAEAIDGEWKWVGDPILASGGDEEEVEIPGNSAAGSGFYRMALGGETAVERYMVVDLRGGASAKSWKVSYTNKVPSGGWTEGHKTTNLVLRWIDAGTFTMGSPTNEVGRSGGSTELQHSVTLTEGFWTGVFEVTQKQWEMAMGNNPSQNKGELRPVENVSYHAIRGAGVGTNWPASGQVDSDSFMGILRAKTGLSFDLPTEAQWEYACRAGTTTALNSGKDLTDATACPNLDELGRYQGNYSDGKGGYSSRETAVGSYLPNAWGLYDMHGNVSEWCLDWCPDGYSSAALTNPGGPATGSWRRWRGGDWQSDAKYCRSARVDGWSPNSGTMRVGFRLVCPADF